MGLHVVKIDNGIYLDGKRLKGVAAYSLKQNGGESTALLDICMDVSILQKSPNDAFGISRNQDEKE